MAGATAAIRPLRIATSRTASILFFGSITWPPFSRRSYAGWANKVFASKQNMIWMRIPERLSYLLVRVVLVYYPTDVDCHEPKNLPFDLRYRYRYRRECTRRPGFIIVEFRRRSLYTFGH